jgi:hypothetical protein
MHGRLAFRVKSDYGAGLFPFRTFLLYLLFFVFLVISSRVFGSTNILGRYWSIRSVPVDGHADDFDHACGASLRYSTFNMC